MMSSHLSADPSAGIYQKELNGYDLTRLPHAQQKGESDHLLKRSDLIDTLNTELSCPICLDLLKSTMVTECLHRFCSECILKCIYKGKRECPTCRKKIISKRNLRTDPNMDRLIDTIWPDRKRYEALQHDKAQKWRENFDMVALQRSIAEGMRAQAKARNRHPSANENEAAATTTTKKQEPRQVANKAKKSLPPAQHGDSCAPKRLRLRSRRVIESGLVDFVDSDFATDSPSDFSSSSSGGDISSELTSDEEGDTQLSKSLIVDVNLVLFNSKSIDDQFIGQLSRRAEKGGKLSSVPKESIPRQKVEDESSGIWSASSSASPFPSNEIPRLFLQNSLDTFNTNFGAIVSMESAMREFVSKTGHLGLITVELAPLPELRQQSTERFRVKLMHGATVEELRVKFVSIYKCMVEDELHFFVRTYLNQMTCLHATESMCTVLALARRPNFYDYPTVFFTTKADT